MKEKLKHFETIYLKESEDKRILAEKEQYLSDVESNFKVAEERLLKDHEHMKEKKSKIRELFNVREKEKVRFKEALKWEAEMDLEAEKKLAGLLVEKDLESLSRYIKFKYIFLYWLPIVFAFLLAKWANVMGQTFIYLYHELFL